MTEIDKEDANAYTKIQKAFEFIKSYESCPDGEACSPFSHYIASNDGIVYGVHNASHMCGDSYCYIGVGFSAQKEYPNSKLLSYKTNFYYFDLTRDNTIVPTGSPNSSVKLEKTTVCPGAYTCTYWTLQTGKIKK